MFPAYFALGTVLLAVALLFAGLCVLCLYVCCGNQLYVV